MPNTLPMELRHFRYFLAVAEELNFRKAAERLHVSAPTLTQQIQDLEESLGTRLLDRSTTHVRLTVAGKKFLEEVRKILSHVEAAQESVKPSADGARSVLHVGYLDVAGFAFLPACITAFAKIRPQVEVSLVNLEVGAQLSALQSGEVQIAFVPSKGIPIARSLSSQVVISSEWHVVVPDRHRLAHLKKVPLAELRSEPLICYVDASGTGPTEVFRAIFAAGKVKPGPFKVVRGIEACLAMVAADQGLTLYPHIPGRTPMSGLVTRPFVEAWDETKIELLAVWRRSETSEQVKGFLDVLRQNTLRHTDDGNR